MMHPPPSLEFNHAMRTWITRHLGTLTLQAAEQAGHRAAAVAVAVTEEGWGAELPDIPAPASWSTRAALILTRRASTLGNHAGQWALPGGRIDAGESAEQAALRELAEEVGLWLDPSALIGRLDDFVTRSGYVITPVVVWAGPAREMMPNPGEVESIHRIPVAEFMRADTRPHRRQHSPGTAHADRRAMDRRTYCGRAVPVSRSLHRRTHHARGAFRATAVCEEIA